MIRIILRGRTGNILFQYALGRALATKHGVPLMLDASWYDAGGWREISHFLKLPIKAKVVRRLPLAARALRKITKKHYWEHRCLPVFREKDDDPFFDARFLDSPTDCVLYGYFQSPRYFENITEELRQELNPLLAQALGWDTGRDTRTTVARASRPPPIIQKLAQPNSIAVHVRRGDYLRLPIFHVCDEQYYRKAMDEMRAWVPDARFFIFSDEPEWCRSAFNEPDTVVIDSGKAGTNPLHDLYLMSLASHHVIANSSYSWWAAWLGDKPGQQVIMPKRWLDGDIVVPMEEKRWK